MTVNELIDKLTAIRDKGGGEWPVVVDVGCITYYSSDASNQPETDTPAKSGDARRLNPHFSRWLMGYPPAWCACADTAMQLSPKSRQNS